MTSATFNLSRPLKTHNGELTALTLQEPTMRSFVMHGEPFSLKTRKNVDTGEPEGVVVYDNNKALAGFLVDMIAEKVDDIVLGAITASDFVRLRTEAAVLIMAGIQDKNFTTPSDS